MLDITLTLAILLVALLYMAHRLVAGSAPACAPKARTTDTVVLGRSFQRALSQAASKTR